MSKAVSKVVQPVVNEPEGIVEWPMDLQPGASNKVNLSFEIQHPKGWDVTYRSRIRRNKMKF